MRQQLRPRVILPVAVLALLGAGVGAYATGGGGGGGDAASEFVVTHKAKAKAAELVPAAVWARKANAVCRDATREYRANEPRTIVEFEPALVKAVATSAEMDEELAALGLPRGKQAPARELLRVSRGGTAHARKLLDALRRGDGKAFRTALEALDRLSPRFDRLAKSVGAHICAADTAGGFEATLKQNQKAMLRHPAKALNLLLLRYRAVIVVFYAPDSHVDGAAVYEARAAALSVEAGFLPVNAKRNSALAKLAERYGVHATPAVLVVTKGPKAVAHFDGFADRETVAQAVTNALR
jgi:hypothetical protein